MSPQDVTHSHIKKANSVPERRFTKEIFFNLKCFTSSIWSFIYSTSTILAQKKNTLINKWTFKDSNVLLNLTIIQLELVADVDILVQLDYKEKLFYCYKISQLSHKANCTPQILGQSKLYVSSVPVSKKSFGFLFSVCIKCAVYCTNVPFNI